jgi:hypothetical protein
MGFVRVLAVVTATFLGVCLVMPIAALCAPFCVVGFLTRQFCRLLECKTMTWEEVIEFDPLIGWRPKAKLSGSCSFAAGVFRVETDALGWAGKASIGESDIVVFGDSYAFGYGVDAEKMFSEVNPRLRIKSIGAPGYNMAQEVLLMRQLSSQLVDKLVVWFIYFGNDLYDNLLPNLYQYRMPFVRQCRGSESWEIVTTHISPQRWPFNHEHNFRRIEKLECTFGDTYQSRRVYSACEFLIGQAKEICTQAGADLVVMTIPWTLQLDRQEWGRVFSHRQNAVSFDPELPDKRIEEICARLHVPLLAGRKHLELHHYILGEGHWNESGHRRVAEILGEFHRNYRAKKSQGIIFTPFELESVVIQGAGGLVKVGG